MFEKMIDNYIDQIKRFNVRSIVLFGSVARNDATEQSDVDILVIASGLPNITERCGFVMVKKPSRIEDIWMTPDELVEMVDAKTGFVWMRCLRVGYYWTMGLLTMRKVGWWIL